jgi:hypothetical protein
VIEDKEWNIHDYVTIKILSCDPIDTFVRKSKKLSFDKVYLAASMAHRMGDCYAMLKDHGQLVLESAKYLLDFNNDQVELYKEKVDQMVKETHFKNAGPSDKLSDYYFYQK